MIHYLSNPYVLTAKNLNLLKTPYVLLLGVLVVSLHKLQSLPMDNIGIIIYFLLGFLLCAAPILVYNFGKSQRLPEVYIQYNKGNTKFTEALIKAGVTQEQTKEVYEYITI